MGQTEKENETAVQSTLKEASKIPQETASSVYMVTQELGENQQDLTGVQHDRSNQKYQSGKLNKKVPRATDGLAIMKPGNALARDEI